MREIKFRSKNIDGLFLYGDLIRYANGDWYIFESKEEIPNEGSYTLIIKETVGEFTGLKDCNGIDIYEKDIIENPEGIKGTVEFLNGSFCSVTSNGTYILNKGYLKNKKVTGNIYETLDKDRK